MLLALEMNSTRNAESKIVMQIETLMTELIDHQQKKVLSIARSILPQLTADDILNPHDFPKLMAHPIFNYEEGLASGLMAAQMAIRAKINALNNPITE